MNVRWLTGFTGTNGAAVLTRERAPVPDRLPLHRAGRGAGRPDFERLPAGRDLVGELAPTLTGRAGFDDAHMSVSTHAQAGGEGGGRGRAGGRRRRWSRTCARSRTPGSWRGSPAAARAGERGAGADPGARPGGPHRARGGARPRAGDARGRGGRTRRFPRSWPRAPTARCPTPSPATCEIPAGTLVVIDWGALLDGYCSDCTRTVATGPLDGRGAGGLRAGPPGPADRPRGRPGRAPPARRSTPWPAR